jgi:hypothetical protein
MLDLGARRANAVWRRSLFVVAMSTLGACGDTTASRVPSLVTAAAGNNQTVATNAASLPLAVAVLDQNGTAMAGVMVSWSIVSGTGSLSSATSTTTDAGQASVEFTAGAASGDVVIDAVVTGLDAVPFAITVTSAIAGG